MDKQYLIDAKLAMRAKTVFLKTALLLMTLFTSQLAAALEEFSAKYEAYREGMNLGFAEMGLQDLGRNKFKLRYYSEASLFFLSDKREEVSLFTYSESVLTPYKYTYSRTGTGRDKALNVQFNAADKTLLIDKETQLAWEGEFDNQLYRLDVQNKLRAGETKFDYELINYRGEKKRYGFEVIGEEQLDLPFGKIKAIKVKTIRANKKRETFSWFAPELDYLVVRLQQFKEGDEQGDIRLSEYASSKAEK